MSVTPPPTPLAEFVTAEDHAQGPEDAPLTLVLYGDFQCPYTRAALPGVNAARADLDQQLRVVFRHFPLVDLHPNALHAAEISEVAADHGQFWDMLDVLFSRQHNLGDTDLVRYAEELGVDGATAEAALTRMPHLPRIQRDVDSGQRSGVPGTPAFYLNDHALSVDWREDGLITALRSHL